jgi:hypothetical protein
MIEVMVPSGCPQDLLVVNTGIEETQDLALHFWFQAVIDLATLREMGQVLSDKNYLPAHFTVRAVDAGKAGLWTNQRC